MADRKQKAAPAVPAMFLAASSPVPDLTSFLDSFKPVHQKHETVLKGKRKPAEMRFTRPAYGRTNVSSRELFHEAANQQMLQSRRFEALRVWFSEPHQALLCRPESTFVSGQPDLIQVTWSPDEKEMRCDLAYVLVPLQWPTPKGMARFIPTSLMENLPGIGTAVLLDLKHSYLAPIKTEEQTEEKKDEKKEAKKEAKNEATKETTKEVAKEAAKEESKEEKTQ